MASGDVWEDGKSISRIRKLFEELDLKKDFMVTDHESAASGPTAHLVLGSSRSGCGGAGLVAPRNDKPGSISGDGAVLVGATGFEPVTLCSEGVLATKHQPVAVSGIAMVRWWSLQGVTWSILGHASKEMTKLYSGIHIERKHEALQKIGFGPDPKGE